MRLRQLWIALGLCAAFAADAAVIYKWTDADGVVHFSDQAVPGAEKIVTSGGSGNGVGGPAATGRSSSTPKVEVGAARLSSLAIESPAPEQVFFGDDVVPIRLHVEPALKATQAISWRLNGKTLDDQAPDAVSFALQTLPRGTYVVAATVTDQVTGESQTADSVTFYVRQPSELSPQHKKP